MELRFIADLIDPAAPAGPAAPAESKTMAV